MPWYISRDGQTYGPYADQQLKAMASAGQLFADTLVAGDDGVWRNATELSWLYDTPATTTIYAPSQPVVVRELRPVVIEKTSKTWKGLQLVGVIVAITGAILSQQSVSTMNPTFAPYAGYLILGGVVCFLFARFAAWWNHG